MTTMASLIANVASELPRHTEAGGNRDDEEDAWIVARDNESVDSFLTNCPPSFMEKAWISAQHDGMTAAVAQYYKEVMGAQEGEAYGREAVTELTAAWEEDENKSLETLTALLKQFKHGGGKWMLFVPAADVDSIWRKIVTALWDGKLGHSAKVSGNTPESNGSHVINVYVDPFWETAEVERVLASLREICGITDAIKYKADGVSNLGIFKGNEYGIPPSFYAANRNSSKLVTQKSSGSAKDWKEREGGDKEGGDHSWGGGDSARSGLHASSRDSKWSSRGTAFSRREERKPRAPPQTKEEAKPQKKASSAFAALSGVDDDDAEAILERKRKKLEKKKRKEAEAAAARAEDAAEDIEKVKAGIGKADWGDMEDDDDDAETALARELEEMSSGSDSSDDDDEEDEEAEKDTAIDVSDAATPAAVVAKAEPEKAKEKTKEELEMEALLASLEAKDEPKEGGGMSKAAAKRAKKKAAAAAGGEAAAGEATAAEAAAPSEEASEETNAPKSAEEIKKMMAAKVAAAKAGKKKGPSDAEAAALKAAKAREAAAPKQKGPKTWTQTGKQVGQKARGSDNKYQGE